MAGGGAEVRVCVTCTRICLINGSSNWFFDVVLACIVDGVTGPSVLTQSRVASTWSFSCCWSTRAWKTSRGLEIGLYTWQLKNLRYAHRMVQDLLSHTCKLLVFSIDLCNPENSQRSHTLKAWIVQAVLRPEVLAGLLQVLHNENSK